MGDHLGAPGDASIGLNIDAAWRQLDIQDTIASKLRFIECFMYPLQIDQMPDVLCLVRFE